MRLSHDPLKTHASFDDPNLVSRAALADLVREHVKIASRTGVNPDMLWHDAMADLFGGIRAPSTLGSFLRSFSWGNVPAGRRGPPAAGEPGGGCAAAAAVEVLAFIELDSMQKRLREGTPSRAPGSGTRKSRARA